MLIVQQYAHCPQIGNCKVTACGNGLQISLEFARLLQIIAKLFLTRRLCLK